MPQSPLPTEIRNHVYTTSGELVIEKDSEYRKRTGVFFSSFSSKLLRHERYFTPLFKLVTSQLDDYFIKNPKFIGNAFTSDPCKSMQTDINLRD